ncbi:MAG: DNA repair protein RadC [Rickettsiaceae bacterium]|nr:DNA repair protein RadC [Rickettsiaceae bacterium]
MQSHEIQSNDDVKPHYIGHRKRLKDKFLQSDPSNFPDYELLELLLFQAIPRKDVKPLAKDLIKRFGNLEQILHSSPDKILEIQGTNNNIICNIKIIRELMNRILKESVVKQEVINSWEKLIGYLKFNMSNLKLEQFRILFLNKKNILIADEIMATGTIDQTPVYVREIVKRSLFHEAGAIILVHNHPSGNSKPSKADINLTTDIRKACDMVNITIHDHVIIGKNEFYSFRTNMLL